MTSCPHGAVNCFECKFPQYFEENLEGTADKFINGTLKAIVPVKVYSSPNGNEILTAKAGQVVGVISSYVTRDGLVWWQLDDAQKWVKHGPGLFDTVFLEKSIADYNAAKQASIDAAVQKRLAENKNPLYLAGKQMSEGIDLGFDTIKWILIVMLVLVILSLIVRLVGK